jgi:Rod binding domain-containing protein
MTINAAIAGVIQSSAATQKADGKVKASIAEASRQFEGILLQQLIRVLHTAAQSSESDSCNENFLEMFDGELASQLADDGGIGIAQEIENSLSGNSDLRTVHSAALTPFNLGRTISSTATLPAGAILGGRTGELQRVAEQLLNSGSQQWSKEGTLTPADLRSQFSKIDSRGNQANFVVREALGYQGYNKCNLFAFELARRAGFLVPVVNRPDGWGYPSSNRVARDAAKDGQLNGGWAKVVGSESAEQLDASIVRGDRAFMLAGSGRDEAQGHMAIVERIRDITYDKNNAIRSIVFDGWEARPKAGAERLVQRTWNVGNGSGGRSARSGFETIGIFELKPTVRNYRTEVPISNRNETASLNSNIIPDHPNDRLETLP